MSAKIDARVRFCRYLPAALLRITGEDSLTFLQGQFTQDLRGLTEGICRYGLWLNQKGRVIADSFVWNEGAGVFLMSYFSSAQTLKNRLEAYVIADDVIIEDATSNWMGIAVTGTGAAEWLERNSGSVVHAREAMATETGWIVRGRRTESLSYEWIFPLSTPPMISPDGEVDAKTLDEMRIRSAIPAIPRDVGPGDLPNEAGLEAAAISYTKGCYLGQEVMARLKTMGQVRRQLTSIEGTGACPSTLPAPVFLGPKKVGEVRSVTGQLFDGKWLGLAMLQTLALEGFCELGLAPDSIATIKVVNKSP